MCILWQQGPFEKNDCFFNPASKNYKPQIAKKRLDRINRNKHIKGRNNQTYYPSKNGSEYADVTFIAGSNIRSLWERTGTDTHLKKRVKNKSYIDSGASAHMCNNKDNFVSINIAKKMPPVSVGNGKETTVSGQGTMIFHTNVDGTPRTVYLKNVLYVPSLMCNLISVSRMRKASLKTVFDTDSNDTGVCVVIDRKETTNYLKGVERPDLGLYEAVLRPIKFNHSALSAKHNSEIWHKRLGHVSDRVLQKTAPMVHGLKIESLTTSTACEPCKLGKSKRDPDLKHQMKQGHPRSHWI